MGSFNNLILIYFSCFFLFAESVYHKSRVSFDKEKGGYVDITVEISSDLNASDCPRILDDTMVTYFTFKV